MREYDRSVLVTVRSAKISREMVNIMDGFPTSGKSKQNHTFGQTITVQLISVRNKSVASGVKKLVKVK